MNVAALGLEGNGWTGLRVEQFSDELKMFATSGHLFRSLEAHHFDSCMSVLVVRDRLGYDLGSTMVAWGRVWYRGLTNAIPRIARNYRSPEGLAPTLKADWLCEGDLVYLHLPKDEFFMARAGALLLRNHPEKRGKDQ